MSGHTRYIVLNSTDGFLIKNRPHSLDVPGTPKWMVDLAYDYSGIVRTPVLTVRHPYYFQISRKGRPDDRISFPQFYRLVETIAEVLMCEWTPPDRETEWNDRPVLYPEEQTTKFLRPWASKRTAWAINKQVHSEWLRLLQGVDAEVLKLQKRVFAVAFGYEDASLLVRYPEIYVDRHLVNDILKFRAAAVAALLCGRMVDPLGAMSDWKSMFSPTGSSYTSLNRTLMNLPGGVPPKVLSQLRRFELARPITRRVELVTAILGNCTKAKENGKIYMFAREDQIRSAIDRISRFTHRDLSWRRWKDIHFALDFMDDFPDGHVGNIVGLAEKSIRWHRDQQQEVVDKVIQQHGLEKEVANPPIPIPKEAGIRFLATISDICEEAVLMEHCVASYAVAAVNGASFLFHVDHADEMATVEVSAYGRVLQAVGPRNRDNVAAQWGRKILQRWGHRIKRHELRQMS